MSKKQVPRSPIVRYDVTVGEYDDFPKYTDEQLKRRAEVENAALNLFRVLSQDPRFIPKDKDGLNILMDSIDLVADYLTCKGYAVYYPETRNCYDDRNYKPTKYKYIHNYYEQYNFTYNEKGEVI